MGRAAVKNFCFALLPALALIAAVELAARLSGVAQSCPGQTWLWVCDPLLYFRTNPNAVVAGEHVNSDGFRGPEFGAKNKGVFRILSLGDSCTFGITAPDQDLYVKNPYPRRLGQLLSDDYGSGRVEVLNAGAPGYNSYQGLTLLRTKLRGLDPDLVTIRFGWNDHLMSQEGRDRNAFRESHNRAAGMLREFVLRTSSFALLKRAALEVRARLARPSPPQIPSTWTPNMSIDDYKYALGATIKLARRMGAKVWLITAPSALSNDSNVQRYDALPIEAPARSLLVYSGVKSFARMRTIHDGYTRATRRVAADTKATLIDMDKIYSEARNRENDAPKLFSMQDALHPTQDGYNLEARVLRDRVVAKHLIVQ